MGISVRMGTVVEDLRNDAGKLKTLLACDVGSRKNQLDHLCKKLQRHVEMSTKMNDCAKDVGRVPLLNVAGVSSYLAQLQKTIDTLDVPADPSNARSVDHDSSFDDAGITAFTVA